MEKDLKYYLSLPYRVEILPDETEGGYALSCPELPGCLTCAPTVEEGLSLPGTRVLMKSGKQMGAVKKALVSGEYEVLMAENCGMEGERLIGRAQDIPEDAGYYSLVIVKEKGETGR